jgi:tripartite-type tricarboxylate transporter receptor subunit TctC
MRSANRLSEDASVRILLLEAGGWDSNRATTMCSTKYITVALVTFALLQSASSSCAQVAQRSSGYPARPISVITPTPGGASDVIARIVTAEMARSMNASFVVDARPGAGGNIATETVAHAPPDGYLLLQAVSSMLTINPILYKKVRFDPIKDFEPISLLALAPYLLAVNPSLGVHSVKISLNTPGGISLRCSTRPQA